MAADYARDASMYAMDNFHVMNDFHTLNDMAINFGDAFGVGRASAFGGGGPVAWAQGDPADSLYRSARDQLNRGDYRKAAGLFKSLPQKYPSSAYVADAEYWQAFSLYRIGGTPELQEALAVLDARKPDAPDGGRVKTAVKVGSSNGDDNVALRTVRCRPGIWLGSWSDGRRRACGAHCQRALRARHVE